MEEKSSLEETRVWDLPTRLFHWLLVLSVSAGWLIGNNLSFNNIQWHLYLGYCTGGLIVFRIIWGFIGPPSARLSALFASPRSVILYLSSLSRRTPSGVPGHNPLGSWAVLAMLATLIVQVSTGLFSESDDFFTEGPLSSYASAGFIRFCNNIHEISSNVLAGLVLLHVAVLIFYLIWKRENLIRPMITGIKLVKRSTELQE